MATRKCLLPCALAVLLLLGCPAPTVAQDEYEGEDEGEGEAGDYPDYGGGGYGDYDDYGGGMGGDADSPSDAIRGVLDLDDMTFGKVVDGRRPAFVEFYAPWCGHCKEFKGEYEELAEAMGAHPELLLVKVDAEANKEIAERFGVEGFPTLMFLPVDGEAELYDGERTAEDIREFLTDRAGDVGQLSALSDHVTRFLNAGESWMMAEIIKEVETAVAEMTPTEASFGKWYVKTMNNVKTKGVAYLEAEFKRLLKMVYDQKDSLKLDKLAEFRIRLAVLKAFDSEGVLKGIEEAKKEEVRAAEEEEYEKDEL